MERVELFDPHGNGQWFDVPDDAYRHVLRNRDAYSIDAAYSSINLQLRYRPARYRGRTL